MIFSSSPREMQRARGLERERGMQSNDASREQVIEIETHTHSLLSSLHINTQPNRICIHKYTFANVTCMRYAANTRAKLGNDLKRPYSRNNNTKIERNMDTIV